MVTMVTSVIVMSLQLILFANTAAFLFSAWISPSHFEKAAA